ncbi:hypothetical protein ACJRO7_004229 [Eucalyptus globulus]|uniref:Retrotransposon gag domain-containing protein n=1 Tax=Eucalyptus globulus TaxID=34317 RepID=A0ABD3J0M5_EUCGL
MGHQAQNQATAITIATTAANVAVTAVATPAEVSLGNVIEERPMHKLVEQFLKLNSLRFSGVGNPKAVALWIQELEKAFALLRHFEEDKYFSDYAREQKMAKFQRLHQGLMSVDQYEAKFTKLSQYAPRLIEDPVDKGRRLEDGLKPKIKDALVPFNLKNYNALYERAQLIERNLNERAAAFGSQFGPSRDNDWFGKRSMTGGRYSIPSNQKGGIGKSTPNLNGACRFYGRQHGSASCFSRTRVCYRCG